MAVFSAIKNKKNQKLREGIEDLAVKCGEDTEKDAGNVDVALVVEQMEKMNIKMEEKDLAKMKKLADKNRKISREDFISYGKNSKGIKEYVDKAGKESHGHARTATVKIDKVKIDKALAAFKAIDKDNSGFVDREEFLNFTSNLPVHKREKLLANLDKDGDGKIDLEEFRQLFERK